ncbi:MAG: tRNA (adenosine(37)-N6)-dimethylallyltransferase MiaA [Oscillospiraceae bacterium]|nr:tRNA (adenosine(37)-N6)-dimethylallyltransferase MiaA [Oscillospiraceae bacterium]
MVGATASGKTAYAIEYAQKHGGEIINADSQQVYEGLDIATAKPSQEELYAIKHHLINVIPREQNFSVYEYVNLAKPIIEDISQRGKIPIICGGTGLYIDTLLNNIELQTLPTDEILRKELENTDKEELYNRLQKIDPLACEKIHPNNHKRICRALEVYILTGKTFTELNEISRSAEKKYDVTYVGLTFSNRETLYNRINLRVDKMLETGLLKEVQEAYKKYGNSLTSSAAIGYKELIPYIENAVSLEDCVENVKKATRNYAKRQITWFRKNKQILWTIII